MSRFLVKSRYLGLCLALLALAACSQQPRVSPLDQADPQIVGGVVTTPGEYPWMVQLQYLPRVGYPTNPDGHRCGGSLVERSWVLTAAHCVDVGDPSDYRVDLGEHHRFVSEGTEQSIDVAEIILHPGGHDIALLRLAAPATLNDRVATIDLDALPPVGTELTVIGWGDTSEGGWSSPTLREVQVPLVSAAECSATYGGISASKFCAGYPEGMKDSCQGDSGGPIFRFDGRWEQVGLVSGGFGCARPRAYGVYVEVADFYNWIYSHVPTSRALAWVWANNPTTALHSAYTPSTSYQYSKRFNALPAADATVTRLETGWYRVTFPNLNVAGGTVHVSAYGGAHHCKVGGWSGGTNTNIAVYCFDAGGRRVNGKFTVLYYRDSEAKSPNYGNAYLWASGPSTASSDYQFNSRGEVNTVRRLSTGAYEVRLPSMQRHPSEPDKGGTVLVSAYGSDATRCAVGYWLQSGDAVLARVHCFAADGSAADSRFTLSFMREPGRLAVVRPGPEERLAAYYAWAGNTPWLDGDYESDSYGAGGGSLQRLGTGSYKLHVPRLKHVNRTTVQVTAYGAGGRHCTIGGWSRNIGAGGTNVYVTCFNSSGARVDTEFTLLYYTNSHVLH